MLVVHRYGWGKRVGRCLVVKPCVSRVVSLQHVCMHHLRCLPKVDAIHTLYTCATKGQQNHASTRTKASTLNYYIYQKELSQYNAVR